MYSLDVFRASPDSSLQKPIKGHCQMAESESKGKQGLGPLCTEQRPHIFNRALDVLC